MPKCRESILLYGVSGAGKTTQGQEFAAAVQKRTSRKTRLVSCTGGGWTSIQPVVELGLIEPLFVPDRDFPVETIDKLSKGYWPEHPADPLSPLLPPEKQKDWKDVGGVMFDSLTEMCAWMMTGAVAREAAGQIKISAQPIRFQDGATQFGTPSIAHFGVFQGRIEDCVRNSKGLDGRYILWTALELKSVDVELSKLPVYGPDIIGKAKTAVAGAWFDNTLHLYITGQGGMKKGTAERRMYFTTHFEDDGVPYVAKNRGHMYAPISKYVGADYLSGEKLSLDYFLELLDRSQAEAKEILSKKLNVKQS